MTKRLAISLIFLCAVLGAKASEPDYTLLVNPFIGTTNFGTCNPGAVCPNGLMSAVPFNVMGSDINVYDKDARWWSTPYENTNSYFTGYSHVNLSGVGCPDLGSLLLMPTADSLDVNYHHYGSTYSNEVAHPGYYTNTLDKYGIRTEVTTTARTSRARFTYHKGQGNVLLNLGEGLTNESGAWVRYVSDTEIEGQKMLGNFCYNSPRAYYPIYYVVRISKTPLKRGYWKLQRDAYGVEKEWNPEAGKYKLYEGYKRDLGGDDIGAYWSFDCTEGEQVEVQIGVSFVSTANARQNLDTEQPQGFAENFDALKQKAHDAWQTALSQIEVEGGTDDQRTVFYTALYHALIHPNILNDVNGDYPEMEGEGVCNGPRYTVFSLWDTYRNLHQLLTLVYPQQQVEMLASMFRIYEEGGWLPKWELFGRETFTMEGDPAIPVIVDTWSKLHRTAAWKDFMAGINIPELQEKGLEAYLYGAMSKGAFTPGTENPLRPDNDPYMQRGYCPMEYQYDNSVSHALEYYMADHALALFADSLGYKQESKLLHQRALGYKHYYSPEFGTLRPICQDGQFYSPFNPKEGENFEPSPGFHEGNAWNYTFAIPYDVSGLTKLMGGAKKYVSKLQGVFDSGNYDPANEPDIVYPYLFSRFKGEEWRTQVLTRQLLADNFKNAPAGIPGNDDTGTMSAWAIFTMMGLYPDTPGEPYYTITAPVFDKVTLHLDRRYYNSDFVIEAPGAGNHTRIKSIRLGNKTAGYRISHNDLISSGRLHITFAE